MCSASSGCAAFRTALYTRRVYALLHARRWHMRIRAHHVFFTICDRCEYFMRDKHQRQLERSEERERESDIFARIIYGLSLACYNITRSTCEAQEQMSCHERCICHHPIIIVSPSLSCTHTGRAMIQAKSSQFITFFVCFILFFPCQISCPTNLRHCRVRCVVIVTTLETRQYE